jgi:hypothetical protein
VTYQFSVFDDLPVISKTTISFVRPGAVRPGQIILAGARRLIADLGPISSIDLSFSLDPQGGVKVGTAVTDGYFPHDPFLSEVQCRD